MNNKNLQASLPEGTLLNQAAVRRLQSDDLSLRHILQAIGRQKWPLLLTIGLISGLAYLLLSRMPDIYESEAQLLFSESRPGVEGQRLSNNRVPVTEGYLRNQIARLSSREQGLLAMVDLGLEDHAEFNQPPSLIGNLLSSGRPAIDDYKVSVDGREAAAPAQSYEYLRENLAVEVIPGSEVVSIRFQSENPKIAAGLVNQLAENFVAQRTQQKQEIDQALNQTFQGQLDQLKRDAEKASRAVQEFKTRNGLDETVGMGLLNQQISQISTELILVRTERAEADARLASVERLMQRGNGVSAIELLNSAEIRKLRDDELQLQKKIKDLSLEYGPKHPVMVSARSQLRSVQSSLSGEASRIVSGVRDEAGVLRAKERSLSDSLERMKQKVETAESLSVELVSLERAAAASQNLLDNYLAKVDLSGLGPANVLTEPSVEILSLGYPGLEAVAPKRLPMLALAFVGSGLLGLMVVFARDSLQQETSIETAERPSVAPNAVASEPVQAAKPIEQASIIPFRGAAEPAKHQQELPVSAQRMVAPFVTPTAHVPEDVEEKDSQPRGLVHAVGVLPDFTRSLPRSRYADAVQGEIADAPLMRSTAALCSRFMGMEDIKSILVTSPDRSDMKALLSVACARQVADAGYRVVVVDLDFAMPSLHHAMGDSNTLGFIDYLDGKINLGATIQRRQGVDLIYAGFREQLAASYFDYDVVLSTATLLARDYDKVVMVGASYLMSGEIRRLSGDLERTIYVLPENARQNRKLLTGIVHSTRMHQKEAGIVYLSE